MICLCVYSNRFDFSIQISILVLNEPMENCVAPGPDKMGSIITSCIVFSQSSRNKLPTAWPICWTALMVKQS